jgi:hypothetical protein
MVVYKYYPWLLLLQRYCKMTNDIAGNICVRSLYTDVLDCCSIWGGTINKYTQYSIVNNKIFKSGTQELLSPFIRFKQITKQCTQLRYVWLILRIILNKMVLVTFYWYSYTELWRLMLMVVVWGSEFTPVVHKNWKQLIRKTQFKIVGW